MNKIVTGFLLLVGIMRAFSANATLIEVSNDLIYDDNTSQYWYRNINEFNSLPGDNFVTGKALAWASTNYSGLTDWHLASISELNDLVSMTSAEEFLAGFSPTGTNDGSKQHPDLGSGEFNYYVGGTDIYSADTFEPMILFYVRINQLPEMGSLSLLMDYGLADGPQWSIGREIGGWMTSAGPAPSPVPEPGTLMLIASGMICLVMLRRIGIARDMQ